MSKALGEMTLEERREVTERALRRFQDELDQTATHIALVLAENMVEDQKEEAGRVRADLRIFFNSIGNWMFSEGTMACDAEARLRNFANGGRPYSHA